MTSTANQAGGAAVNPRLPVERIGSVDIYRGFVMFLMMAEVLMLEQVSRNVPDSTLWRFLAFHQSHVHWSWLSLHDLIQPSFTFLVGVVLPYSVASRRNKGATTGSLIRHTLVRSLILVFLGIFLRSIGAPQTYFTFEDTLTQIGLGYPFLVLLGFCSKRTQLISLGLILSAYWLAFALYPLPGPGFDYAAAGVEPDWPHNFSGFAAHWNKNTNLAWAFDTWFLNLFPRESVFLNNGGGYATLSFIPTLGTMILGLQAGNVLRSSRLSNEKLRVFIIAGAALVVAGVILHVTGINPVVKRIWTPAWTIFSGGICFLMLAFFYGIVDVAGIRKWSFVFMILGVNSIAAYVIADGGMRQYISSALITHLGENHALVLGNAYAPFVTGLLVLFLEWLILYWMYKRRIFIKI